MRFISLHITPLVINGLGGGHTHTHAYIRTEAILKKVTPSDALVSGHIQNRKMMQAGGL